MRGLTNLTLAALIAIGAAASPARAQTGDTHLTVIPSSTEITEDENLSVEFKTVAEGVMPTIGAPHYSAPDFDEINFYSASSGTETTILNGRITMRQSRSVVAVLHPKHAGHLTISRISVTVNGKPLSAADVSIEVRPSGTRLSGRQGGGTGYPAPSKLPNSGPHGPSQANAGTFFIKAEPSKLKCYKGEQIILTYALYSRARILNVQVERYPNPQGFLKEDIDIPLLRGHLDYTPSVVNGHEYRRAVLAQYAIYPLKDGSLPIDTFTAKFAFQAAPSIGGNDEDDPFAMINNFFRAMQTTTETRTSDRVSIEVMPLPGAGQPANFTGLVGDFDIAATADRTTVKAGEPVNIRVKVEGRGHAGSLEHLNVNWPQDFELYEDKSNTLFSKTGQSERDFEYMIIPKSKGHYEIPAIELSMFNPETRSYQTRKSQPIGIEVLEGGPATVYVPKSGSGAPALKGEDIRYWKDSIDEGHQVALRAVARGVALGSMVLAVLSLWSLGTSPDEETRVARQKTAQALRQRAQDLKKSTGAPVEVLGEVESLLAQAVELQFGISIGSLTRAEVTQALLDRARIDEATARRVEALIELVELQRYAPGGGDRAGAQRAAEELSRLMERIYPA